MHVSVLAFHATLCAFIQKLVELAHSIFREATQPRTPPQYVSLTAYRSHSRNCPLAFIAILANIVFAISILPYIAWNCNSCACSCAVVLYKTARDVVDLFRAVAPVVHKDVFDTVQVYLCQIEIE